MAKTPLRPRSTRERRRHARAWWQRVAGSRVVRGLASTLFFTVALWLIWRQVSAIDPKDFLRVLLATGAPAVAGACALTVASYLCLSVTEWLALKSVGRPLPFRRALLVAVPAYALTNSAGFSAATGTAVRLQLYARDGLKARRSAAVALVAGAAVTLSGLVAAGLGVLAELPAFARLAPGGALGALAAGLVLLAPASLWRLAFTPGAPRWLGGGRPGAFDARTRTLGLLAGVGDWLFSCAALFVLLPHPEAANFPAFLAAFVAGSVLSAATGVPGGIGVFEAIVLTLTSRLSLTHETAAALLLYRAVYSLLPLSAVGLYLAARRVGAWPRTRRMAA